MTEIHCVECEYEGTSQKITKGSFILEVVLWLCFLIPGICYSFWRITAGRYYGCPDCKSERVVELSKWLARSKTA